jgi:aquaporin NIP
VLEVLAQSMRDLRPELAEAVGTFILMLAGGGAIVSGQSGFLVAAAFGVAVMVMVYALGHVCGAHYNPAITLGFAATGHFPWRRVPGYVVAQVLGALAACTLLTSVGPVDGVVANGSLHGMQAFAVEVLATFTLAFVIIAVATDKRAAPGLAGVAIGAAVFLGALVAGPLSGASMNPARTLAPIVIARHGELVMHVLGPLVGGVLGMATYEFLRGGSKPKPDDALGSAGPIDLEPTT